MAVVGGAVVGGAVLGSVAEVAGEEGGIGVAGRVVGTTVQPANATVITVPIHVG